MTLSSTSPLRNPQCSPSTPLLDTLPVEISSWNFPGICNLSWYFNWMALPSHNHYHHLYHHYHNQHPNQHPTHSNILKMVKFIIITMTEYDQIWLNMTKYDWIWLNMTMTEYDWIWLKMTEYDWIWLPTHSNLPPDQLRVAHSTLPSGQFCFLPYF